MLVRRSEQLSHAYDPPSKGSNETCHSPHGSFGRDLLGDDGFVAWIGELGRTQPDSRDFDHLHAHMLHDPTHFLTWEKSILNLAGDLSIQGCESHQGITKELRKR